MSQIANEVTILNAIQENFKNRNCFPKLYASGIESGRLFMLMDLLGPNLYDLMSICGGKFSLQTSLLLVIQIVFFRLFRLREYKFFMTWDIFIEISNLKIF